MNAFLRSRRAFFAALLLSGLPLVCTGQTLTVVPSTPGNVFTANTPIRIPVVAQAQQVAWTATDYAGQTRQRGVAIVSNGQAVLAPALSQPGYYRLALSAQVNGVCVAQGQTSFAVLPPANTQSTADSPYGVMTHFAQWLPVDAMSLISRAGIKNIRDEQYWTSIEKTPGQFTYDDYLERYMAQAANLSINPLVVLDFGSPFYDKSADGLSGGNAPFTDVGRAAYARYGVNVAQHYGPEIHAVEVWNEYNGSFASGPATQDLPGSYFQMLKTIYPALKQARPDMTVAGVSAVETPLPYFESLFKLGALSYMDAVSLHPYRTQSPPEGLDDEMNGLQNLIKRYNNGQAKPIWITELGWPLKAADATSNVVITEATQAKYLVRAVALIQSAGVQKFFWYQAQDDWTDTTMGLLHGPYDAQGSDTPKPAYVAYATLIQQLGGASFEAREPMVNDSTYTLRFRRGSQLTRVMWSASPETIALQAATPLTVVNIMGETRMLPPINGVVSLALSDAPVYVIGNVTGLPPMISPLNHVVADSMRDFSGQQGVNGWTYGSFTAPAPGGPYSPGAWTPLSAYGATPWDYEWVGNVGNLNLAADHAEPAVTNGGNPVWAVRRWTSTATGSIRIHGTFGCPSQGDGTTARVFVDGRLVWKRLIGGTTPSFATCDVTVPVKTGSLVDIAVDPGLYWDSYYDSTTCHVTINE